MKWVKKQLTGSIRMHTVSTLALSGVCNEARHICADKKWLCYALFTIHFQDMNIRINGFHLCSYSTFSYLCLFQSENRNFNWLNDRYWVGARRLKAT